MLKCEEKIPQQKWNLNNLILRETKYNQHLLCSSHTKWKPDLEWMMAILAPGMEHAHEAGLPNLTDPGRVFYLSHQSFTFFLISTQSWVQNLPCHLQLNNGYVE